MPTELPIACTLDAAGLTDRLAEMSALGAQALTRAELDGRHAGLRFAARPGLWARLDAVVAAEAQCCAFLDMRLREEGGDLVLDVRAPAGAEPVLAEIVAAFRGAAAGEESGAPA